MPRDYRKAWPLRAAICATLLFVRVHPGVLVAGKYRVIQMIGEGGMGSVWLARNEVTERDFAIKFLHETPGRSQSQVPRFFQEAKIASKLRHPSVVEVFDAGTEPALDNAPYLVMEALDGIGLDRAISRAGTLPLGLSLEIIAEIARALALAHEKGIIHRDLKPSNVFLHRIGNGALVPKVLDFGISKILVDESGRQISSVTQTGAILGSPLYMSPEQAAGDKTIDARSDVHALGVMLWECLLGQPPFRAETHGLLLVEIIQGPRPELSGVLPRIPPDVSALVQRAMARDRDTRFAHAGEFADAVEQAILRLGHKSMLSTRSGATDFNRLLEGHANRELPQTSSTTGAVAMPASSPSAPALQGARAQSAAVSELGEPLSVAGVPKSRLSPLIFVLAALGVITAGLIAITRFTSSSGEPASSAAAEIAAASVTPPAVSQSPPVIPTLAAPAAPTPSASSPAPSPVAVQGSNTKRGPSAKAKPKLAPSASPGAAPVHHGVTSSGL